MEYCTLLAFQPSLEATMWGQCYDVSRQLVQQGEASFYYYTPSPSPMRAMAIHLACGGRTCSSGFDTSIEVVVTSLFVFSKRRRAKRNPNVAVANTRVVRCLGARI